MTSTGYNYYVVDVCYPSIRGFLNALASIAPGNGEFALVSFNDQGLTIKWEHKSKALQSSIYVATGLFSTYDVHQDTAFSIPLDKFFQILEVFERANLGKFTLRYPGPESELVLEAVEAACGDQSMEAHRPLNTSSLHHSNDNSIPTTSIYARLRTSEAIQIFDLINHLEYSTGQHSYFITDPYLLKEAIDDLEWAQSRGPMGGRSRKKNAPALENRRRGGGVLVTMTRDPAQVRCAATSEINLSLEVQIPTSAMHTFYVAGPQVEFGYTYAHLKSIFANVDGLDRHPRAREMTTHLTNGISNSVVVMDDVRPKSKVSINQDGIMKVVHMLPPFSKHDTMAGTSTEMALHHRPGVNEEDTTLHHRHASTNHPSASGGGLGTGVVTDDGNVAARVIVATYALLALADLESDDDDDAYDEEDEDDDVDNDGNAHGMKDNSNYGGAGGVRSASDYQDLSF